MEDRTWEKVWWSHVSGLLFFFQLFLLFLLILIPLFQGREGVRIVILNVFWRVPNINSIVLYSQFYFRFAHTYTMLIGFLFCFLLFPCFSRFLFGIIFFLILTSIFFHSLDSLFFILYTFFWYIFHFTNTFFVYIYNCSYTHSLSLVLYF